MMQLELIMLSTKFVNNSALNNSIIPKTCNYFEFWAIMCTVLIRYPCTRSNRLKGCLIETNIKPVYYVGRLDPHHDCGFYYNYTFYHYLIKLAIGVIMSRDLKHGYIYVLELSKIVTPVKARLAFISSLNQCTIFHYYCRHCGVKLSGKNINKQTLDDTINKQPHCSDWRGIAHKKACPTLKNVGPATGGTGRGITPQYEYFIPEHLSFQIPNFIIKVPDVIPDEINSYVLSTTPIDLNIDNSIEANSTYMLKDVIDAHEWLETQNLKDEEWPKIRLGDNTFSNQYKVLFKEFYLITYSKDKIFYGYLNPQAITNTDDFFSFEPVNTIWSEHLSSKIYTDIIIPTEIYRNTILNTMIDKIISLKKDDIKIKFYLVPHWQPTEPSIALSSEGKEYYEHIIRITNPYLIVFTFA